MFSVPGSPSPIIFVAMTENVYITPGAKLVKLTLLSLYTVTVTGHLDLLVHETV